MEDTTPTTSPFETADNGLPRITCGCGFTVTGEDETNNRLAYEEHDCPSVDAGPDRWYEHVFGFWGFWAIVVIAWAVVEIVNHGKG